MNKIARATALVAVALTLFSAAGCNKLRARDHLNKGVQSYKNAKYEEAIAHFQRAVSLDPGLLNARLYLATAFAQLSVSGASLVLIFGLVPLWRRGAAAHIGALAGQSLALAVTTAITAHFTRDGQLYAVAGMLLLIKGVAGCPPA